MQLYGELLFIAAGFAGATLVSKWASDENDGRLEEILSVPMSRSRWVIAGGVAALIGVVVMTVLFAAGIAIGAAAGGISAGDAILGCAALGLFAAAVVGVGFAVGGVWRTSLAAEIAALFVVVTYLLGLVAPALKLPDWVQNLALTNSLRPAHGRQLGHDRRDRLDRHRGRRHPHRRVGRRAPRRERLTGATRGGSRLPERERAPSRLAPAAHPSPARD